MAGKIKINNIPMECRHLNYFNKWHFIFYFPFAFFLALGPFPIDVYILTAEQLSSLQLFFGLCFLFFTDRNKKNVSQFIIVLLIYFISLLPSVIFSENFEYSYLKIIIFTSYILLFLLLVSINNYNKLYRNIFIYNLLSIYLVCFLIIYLYFYSDYSGEMRFAIAADYHDYKQDAQFSESGAVDPNTTAIGLMLIFAFCLPGILSIKRLLFKNILFITTFCIVILSIWCLQSRTGMVGVLISVSILYFSNNIFSKNEKLILFSILTLTSIVLVIFFNNSIINENNIFDRLSWNQIQSEESQSGGRLDHIEQSISSIFSTPENFLFGSGFFTSNPHNEYIRNFRNSGIFSGFLFLFFLAKFFIYCKNRSVRINGHQTYFMAMIAPVFFMLSTYGHTKNLWVGLAFAYIVSNFKLSSLFPK